MSSQDPAIGHFTLKQLYSRGSALCVHEQGLLIPWLLRNSGLEIVKRERVEKHAVTSGVIQTSTTDL